MSHIMSISLHLNLRNSFNKTMHKNRGGISDEGRREKDREI